MNYSLIDILLIEDNVYDAEMTVRAFKQNILNNNVIHVLDGQKALDYLFSRGEYSGKNIYNKPKLILLDLNLPKIHGLDVLEQIKTSSNLKDIPVVVLTASKDNLDRENCNKFGVYHFLNKPVNFDDFIIMLFDLGLDWMLDPQWIIDNYMKK